MANRPKKQVTKTKGKQRLPDAARPFMWKPGQSGNPKGRPPKGACLTSLLKEFLEQQTTLTKDGKPLNRSWMEVFIEAMVMGAIKGKVEYGKEIFNRVEGRVPLALQNPDGSGIMEPLGHAKTEKMCKAMLKFIKTKGNLPEPTK